MVGFSGFGFALIAVPPLTLVLGDPHLVIPLELLMATFCVMVLSANKLRFIKEPAVIFIVIGMFAGIPVGAYVLANFEAGLLKKILGAVVILFGAHIYLEASRDRDPKTWDSIGRSGGIIVAIVVGVLSGIAGGMFGTSGPPLVIYVDHFAKDKSAFRAQLLVLFLLNDLFRIPLYVRYSLMTLDILKFALWLLPAVCVGLFLGSRMHFEVSEKTFGRAVAAMLCISGVLLLIRP